MEAKPERRDSQARARRAEDPADESPPFEAAFRAAEEAVEALERGQLTLEESLKRYEEGLRALARCHEILRDAEKRIEVLGSVEEGEGGPVWVPASGSAALREALGAAEAPPRRAEEGNEASGNKER